MAQASGIYVVVVVVKDYALFSCIISIAKTNYTTFSNFFKSKPCLLLSMESNMKWVQLAQDRIYLTGIIFSWLMAESTES